MYLILQLVALETGTVYLDEQFTEKQVVYKDMNKPGYKPSEDWEVQSVQPK